VPPTPPQYQPTQYQPRYQQDQYQAPPVRSSPSQPPPLPPSPVGGHRRPPGGHKRGLIIGGVLAGAAAAYLVIAAIGHAPPFTKPAPSVAGGRGTHTSPAAGTPIAHAQGSHSGSPSPSSTGTTLPGGVKSIEQYLPVDISPVNDCQPVQGIQWKNPGLVQSFDCSDPGLADPNGGKNGFVEAFQMNGYQNFSTSWQNFNAWFGFTKSQASCPLGGPSGGGLTGWEGPGHAARTDQVLECADSGTSNNIASNQEIYAWTYPADNAYMIAVAPSSWTGSQLDSWWKQNSQ
jgi:hypothetical protein